MLTPMRKAEHARCRDTNSFHAKKSLEKWNRLSPEIVNTAVYYDGAILHPERIGIEMVLDAEAESQNAHALNYVSMVGGQEDTIILPR